MLRMLGNVSCDLKTRVKVKRLKGGYLRHEYHRLKSSKLSNSPQNERECSG